MSLSKTALLNVLGRGDGPRRETLREERARDKAKLPEDETEWHRFGFIRRGK